MTTTPRDNDIGRYGRWADSYNGSILQRLIFGPLHEFTLQQAATSMAEPHTILDIGCGTGLLLQRAGRRFPSAELTGIDAAEEMILVAQLSIPAGAPVRFMQGFAEQLPFPAASFDLVLSTISFHHWTDQVRGLHEVQRVLLPGGVLALADAMSAGWLRWLLARSHHGRFHTPSDLTGMLHEAGLQVEGLAAVPHFAGSLRVALARAPDANR
jgi:ubiquinone/menaquinone biosynthesis C-methylase UbiE